MRPGSSRACRRSVRASLRSRSRSFSREVRPEGGVRHQRQRLAQPRDRHAQANGRGVPAGARREPGAEEVHGVGHRERILAARPLVQHVRGHGGEALPPAGSAVAPARTTSATSTTGTSCIGTRWTAQAVGEREPFDAGHHERPHGAGLRRSAAVRLGEDLSGGERRRRRDRGGEHDLAGVHRFTSGTARSFFPVGTTDTSTLPAPRRRAAACTSLGSSER